MPLTDTPVSYEERREVMLKLLDQKAEVVNKLHDLELQRIAKRTELQNDMLDLSIEEYDFSQVTLEARVFARKPELKDFLDDAHIEEVNLCRQRDNINMDIERLQLL
jgi:hypothetical protein